MQPSRQPDYVEGQALLPESVQQIAGLIGFPATEALTRHFGGVPFRSGKGLRGAGERRTGLLQEVLTPSQVALRMRHFGGEELYSPAMTRRGAPGATAAFWPSWSGWWLKGSPPP